MRNIYTKKIITKNELIRWIGVLSIFTFIPYELGLLTLSVLFILTKTKLFYIPKRATLIYLLYAIYAIASLVIRDYTLDKFFQQYILIFITCILYYNFFRYNKLETKNLFCKYLKLAYYVSLLGIVQFIICFFLKFNIFNSFLLEGIGTGQLIGERFIRIHSITFEPGTLGALLMPAASYIIIFNNSLGEYKKYQSLIIILTILLTISANCYLIFFIIVITKYILKIKLKYRKYIIGIFLLLASIFISTISMKDNQYGNNENGLESITMKLTQTLSIFNNIEDPTNFELLNLSTYAFATNTWVALNAPNRILGTGLGSHEQNYRNLYIDVNNYSSYGINASDGYSLFNRILSEFGIIGIALYIYFLIHFFRRNVISMSVFFILLALFLRGGHYVLYGNIFFHYLYIYASKTIKNEYNHT